MGEKSLSHLMNISIESPEKLSDSDLENIVDVWNRKHRRMYIMIHNTELYNYTLHVQTSSGHVIGLGANINMYVYQPSELGI